MEDYHLRPQEAGGLTDETLRAHTVISAGVPRQIFVRHVKRKVTARIRVFDHVTADIEDGCVVVCHAGEIVDAIVEAVVGWAVVPAHFHVSRPSEVVVQSARQPFPPSIALIAGVICTEIDAAVDRGGAQEEGCEQERNGEERFGIHFCEARDRASWKELMGHWKLAS